MRGPILAAILLAMIMRGGAIAAVSVDETSRLIRHAEKGVEDTRGWASDLLDVLRDLELDASRENVCASIAVIDQESSFSANPAVKGLGRLSEAALRAKLGRIPIAGAIVLRKLETLPSADDSYMMRIRSARTERDLDLIYRSLIDDIARRTSLGLVVNSGLMNRFIDERNQISTAGSMQVSVAFAINDANKRRWLPMSLQDTYAVRDELYTRRGGMYYGVKQLLGYDTGYSRKIYRFSDYNAGRYASRNAAFQLAVAELSASVLALDGDLLLYDGGTPRTKTSETERALRSLDIGLDNAHIRDDLMKSKRESFAATPTFLKVRDLYRARFGKDAPFAIVPEIRLSSPKITRPMTTRSYAETVNNRYQSCMATK